MNEQEFIEAIIAGDLNAFLHNLDLCIQEQAEESEQPESDAGDGTARSDNAN